MDRTKKTHINLIVLGLFIAVMGIYFTFSSLTYLVTSAITISELAILDMDSDTTNGRNRLKQQLKDQHSKLEVKVE